MDFISTRTTYEQTGFFSTIILDYLEGKEPLRPFYCHPVTTAGIKASMAQRRKYPTDRTLLVSSLKENYSGAELSDRTKKNIELLASENTFTITTAHQPNIFTGHLYFLYKILHAIRLAESLKREFPENDFVPVYYMGSEDADLDELGHVYVNGTKHAWQTTQTGAVGRMKVDKALVRMLDAIAGEITVLPHGQEIIGLMKDCYKEGATIEQATFRLVNALFGVYGLVILLPDNPKLKSAFAPVTRKELQEGFSHGLVAETVAAFSQAYKVQAGGRDINLFYLRDDIRERIEKEGDRYTVINSSYSFSEAEILEELNRNPERFSPNVILRPVFQEMILPNIAFIGGGGEIAYWLELKKVFEATNVPFPVLVLRNSFMVVDANQQELARKLGLGVPELFKTEADLLNRLVKRDSKHQLTLSNELEALKQFYEQLGSTAAAIDITLQRHTEVLYKRAHDKLEALEKKMLRAEKRKFEAQQRQLHKLKQQLFPNANLQERIDNFMPYYARWGKAFIESLYANSLALEQQFVIMESRQ